MWKDSSDTGCKELLYPAQAVLSPAARCSALNTPGSGLRSVYQTTRSDQHFQSHLLL